MRSFLFVPADSERKLAKGPAPSAGALTRDGKMLDRPHLVLARRLLERAR